VLELDCVSQGGVVQVCRNTELESREQQPKCRGFRGWVVLVPFDGGRASSSVQVSIVKYRISLAAFLQFQKKMGTCSSMLIKTMHCFKEATEKV
jgi:hypothetical protein